MRLKFVPAVVDEVQAAVEQLAALERRRLGDPVEGFQRRVDLQLVGRDLLVAQGARVGRLRSPGRECRSAAS